MSLIIQATYRKGIRLRFRYRVQEILEIRGVYGSGDATEVGDDGKCPRERSLLFMTVQGPGLMRLTRERVR
jgi:hypothetical protein